MTSHGVWLQLQGDDEFLKESIILLYNLQASTEKLSKSTHLGNGVGFNKGDAPTLSRIAEFIIKYPDGYKLSALPDDLLIAREKMLKYSRQIAEILNLQSDI